MEIPVVGIGEGDIVRVPEAQAEVDRLGEGDGDMVGEKLVVGEGEDIPVVGMGD